MGANPETFTEATEPKVRYFGESLGRQREFPGIESTTVQPSQGPEELLVQANKPDSPSRLNSLGRVLMNDESFDWRGFPACASLAEAEKDLFVAPDGFEAPQIREDREKQAKFAIPGAKFVSSVLNWGFA